MAGATATVVRRGLPVWLAFGVCVSVAASTWLGYRAIRSSQVSSMLLATRETGQTADLFAKALARDMDGVRQGVLVSPKWNEYMLDSPNELRSFVAGAFARYPYPESFFSTRGLADSGNFVFLNRTERPPAWVSPVRTEGRFPVTIDQNHDVADRLRQHLAAAATGGALFIVFDLDLVGAPYQVVARLLYRDPLHESFAGAFGFTVNLDWARQRYFRDFTKQIASIGSVREGFALRVVDEKGAVIVSTAQTSHGGIVARRPLALVFADPMLAENPSIRLTEPQWSVEVERLINGPGSATPQPANWTLAISAVSAVMLAVGLVLAARATRAHARLSEMRSDFVSSVTHELKTPIATIRAAGDTLTSGRSTRPDATAHYAQVIVQESKRLSRLIDNLLTYARIIDVTEAYTFEAQDISDLVMQSLHRYDSQLSTSGFDVRIDIPNEIPPVNADAVAMELLFDNLIDNAIRYSTDRRALVVRARRQQDTAIVEVTDYGVGIAADELRRVTRRFYRGRRAGPGGSGLGLAIAERIIVDHRGRMEIASEVGRGTTVTVTLPVASGSV